MVEQNVSYHEADRKVFIRRPLNLNHAYSKISPGYLNN